MPRAGAVDNHLVNIFGAADVEAAGRVEGDQHLGAFGQFPGDDDLLDIAAGQITYR
jgi:hypothetical protein